MKDTQTTTRYRCTREDLYRDTNCPGKEHKSARQGHYVTASSVTEALKEMRRMFPDDLQFTVDVW